MNESVPAESSSACDSAPDVEYRLTPGYRRPMLIKFAVAAVVTVLCAISRDSILEVAAYATGAVAVVFGVLYLWQGRFATKVTGRGIEVRGYFDHFVPWEVVRDIEVNSRIPWLAMIPDASARIYPGSIDARVMPEAHDGLGDRTAPGLRGLRVASINVVRADGSKVRLRAPLFSGSAPDPDFYNKVEQLDQICMRSGRGAIG